MRQADGIHAQECRQDSLGLDERGTTFMTVMMIMLMAGTLGVSALTMTGLENSMAGAIRMVEEGTDAAESCVGMSVNVIQNSVDPGVVPATLIAPAGPVPAANAAILSQEINGAPVSMRNNPDVAVGAGNAPNITMAVNNYLVNGDIDFLYSKQRAGSDENTKDFFYRVDCTAANAATGATSRVIAVFDCLHLGSDTCQRRAL
ncbi:MAG: hypothetical protein CAF44_006735 [Nitrospira sp. CG24D]|nr:MAG: hypothetical protein CAF44_006735 [Nitrospira sp. CG24D]